MNKKHIYILLCLFCLSSFLQAQVTIGSLEVPVRTAILDIKEMTPADPSTDNTTAKTGGLGMPRVSLVDLESLEPFIDPADVDYNEQKILHTGLTVYNVAKVSVDITPGVYYWDGVIWNNIVATSGYFNLSVSATELFFPSNVGLLDPSNDLTIRWEPASERAKLTLTPIFRGGVKGYIAPPTTDISGNQKLTIVVDAMTQSEIDVDPFLERASQLQVVSTDGVGGFKQENVILRQTNYALIVNGFRDKMDLGKEYEFTVASNTDWTVTVSDLNNILESYRTSAGGNKIEGENFKFKIRDDNMKEGFSATFTFTNPDGKFPPQSYKVTATRYYPNSYIVTPGQGVVIPVRKAYNVWSQEIGTTISGTVTAQVLWQDKQSLIAAVALLNGDKGINSEISVITNGTPAGISGNAVIAVSIGGTIRWSWHIWVTNYNPNSKVPAPAPVIPYTGTATIVDGGRIFNYNNGIDATVFMDRNLGATTAVSDDANWTHYGQLYQWGRKDPFPNTSRGPLNTYPQRPIYSAGNVALTGINGITHPEVSAAENLGNSISNPKAFYLGTPVNDYDWYGQTPNTHDDYLWSDKNGDKGIYDPCPDGWRVPLPTGGLNSPWLGLTILNTNTKAYTDGFDWTNLGAGYYPASRLIKHNGEYDMDAGRGLFSAANPNGAVYKSALYIDRENISFGPYSRARGEAIRCAKERK